MNLKEKLAFGIKHGILPLLSGGFIYLFFRPSDLIYYD